MPTFSQSLEQSLHRALAIANERHHQYATLEHLLLSLIDDSDAAAVMRACSVDLDKLRGSLVNYLETEFENLVTDGSEDAKPTAYRWLVRIVIILGMVTFIGPRAKIVAARRQSAPSCRNVQRRLTTATTKLDDARP